MSHDIGLHVKFDNLLCCKKTSTIVSIKKKHSYTEHDGNVRIGTYNDPQKSKTNLTGKISQNALCLKPQEALH